MASPLMASVNAQDLYVLDEVVVTATRTEKALIDVPVRTEVINREQIERIHARDLKEALDYIPGLILKKIHGKSGYSVWLQGMDSERVLVLIDGEPLSASTGSTVDLTQISAMEIERVEVVKGASSALYGSSAMGGVINVITRRPENPLDWSLTVDGGSWGDDDLDSDNVFASRHAGANLSIKEGKWSALVAADIRDSDGYDLDKSTFSTQGDSGFKSNIHTRFAYQPNQESEIYFSPKYYLEDIQNQFTTVAPGTALGEIRKNNNEVAERKNLTIGGNTLVGNDARLSSMLMFENFQDDTQQDVLATDVVDQRREATIDTAKFEMQWDQPIGDSQVLTTGVVFFEEALEQTQERLNNGTLISIEEIQGDAERDNQEIFIQDDIFVNDSTELLFGARAQDDSDFGSHVVPKISLLLSPDWTAGTETRIRASIGQGYRVPNLKERFFIFDHSALGYMVLGNPDLEPEGSTNFQLGAELIGVSSRFDVNFFYNEIDDLIETDLATEQTLPGIQLFEYVNIAEARTRGVELSWNQKTGDNWRYGMAYSYLDAEDSNTGKALPDRPEDQLKLELGYHYKPWQLDVSLLGVYQSSEFVDVDNNIESPAWKSWDLKINQQINPTLTLFFGIDNLGDEHRQRFDGTDNRPVEGRFIYTGLRFGN